MLNQPNWWSGGSLVPFSCKWCHVVHLTPINLYYSKFYYFYDLLDISHVGIIFFFLVHCYQELCVFGLKKSAFIQWLQVVNSSKIEACSLHMMLHSDELHSILFTRWQVSSLFFPMFWYFCCKNMPFNYTVA